MADLDLISAILSIGKELNRIAAALEECNKLLTPAEALQDESEIEEPSLYRSSPLQTLEEGAGEADRTDTSTWGRRLERNLEALKSRPRG